MKLRYRFRIYPTDQQKGQLAKLFGCCRVVFNDALAHCQQEYREGKKKPDKKQLSSRLTELKKTEEKNWLGEVSAVPLQQSLRDLEQAYSNFFESCKGQRKGKKVKPPKFKKRKYKQSAKFTNNGFKVNQHNVYLAKVAEGHSETKNGRGGRHKTVAKIAVSCEASTTPKYRQLSLF